jgi:hypothetical protein
MVEALARLYVRKFRHDGGERRHHVRFGHWEPANAAILDDAKQRREPVGEVGGCRHHPRAGESAFLGMLTGRHKDFLFLLAAGVRVRDKDRITTDGTIARDGGARDRAVS